MRAGWRMPLRLATAGLATLLATSLAAPSASAQHVVQQAVLVRYDVDSAIARATQLRRQNRKLEAERVMARAVAMAPSRSDARALHEQLAHEVRGGEAMLGGEVRSWREQLPEWREAALSGRQNTGVGPVVARLSRVERGPMRDERLELEAYPAFPHGYVALGAGLATGATVYAHTTASGEEIGRAHV